ncbi:hypothetical protein M758_UG318300 [Ceratodon purpureus]|nr:hypothetical protein M758_UG318300 [Ceratodon purpureus]
MSTMLIPSSNVILFTLQIPSLALSPWYHCICAFPSVSDLSSSIPCVRLQKTSNSYLHVYV